jgi:4-hydroxy-3-methylbut-2-enyl diphosphate reductase IspH
MLAQNKNAGRKGVKVILANPRGICAGVVRAVDIVDLALETHGPPVYVLHEIVHNWHVVEDLRAKGAVFIDDLTEVPHGAVTVFSAHGVSDVVCAQAQTRELKVIDALRARFPGIRGPQLGNICYATQNRQNAVKELAQAVDVILVVGARNSSNSNRLREVAEKQGVVAYLVADETELEAEWVEGRRRIGVTAGASAPEVLVRGVVWRLRELGADRVEEMAGNRETVMFKLPEALAAGPRAARWENKKAR